MRCLKTHQDSSNMLSVANFAIAFIAVGTCSLKSHFVHCAMSSWNMVFIVSGDPHFGHLPSVGSIIIFSLITLLLLLPYEYYDNQ